METAKEQEGNIDYLDDLGTTEDGGISINYDGVTYSTDDEAMIEIDGTVYTMDDLNNYEGTKKYKPQIVKAIKTAKDAKRIYDYLKYLTKIRINLKSGDPVDKKKLEELKDPWFFTNKIKKFVNNTGKGISDFKEKNKNSKTAYIVGSITTIFIIYFFYRTFKITYITSYFNTFLFLLKRMFFFTLIISLIILTYVLIIKYFPWFTELFIRYFILMINPLNDNGVNDTYNKAKEYKFLATFYLVCCHAGFTVLTFLLLIFLVFILAPFITILGYTIGVSLTFMDD